MTADEYRTHIRKLIDEKFDGVQVDAARAWGIAPQHLSVFLLGGSPFKGVLDATGFERVKSYQPVAKSRAAR